MGTPIVSGDKLGKEICDVLGIKHCNLLDIHIAKDEIITVTARIYPDKDGVRQLPDILKKYQLVPIPEDVTCIGDESVTYQRDSEG